MSIEDPVARAIICTTAATYGVTTEAILATVKQRHDRTPVVFSARVAAIQALSNEKIDGRYRFPVSTIAKWFGVTRITIDKQRRAAPGYTRRQTPRQGTA